jgi:hypothetical protein
MRLRKCMVRLRRISVNLEAIMLYSDDDSFANDDYLLFSGPTWFVGPFPRPAQAIDLIERIVTLNVGKEEGMLREVPVVFRKLEFAQECVKELDRKWPDKAGRLKPFASETPLEFARALEILIQQGHTHIAIDPGAKKVRVPSIQRLIDAIQAKFGEQAEQE